MVGGVVSVPETLFAVYAVSVDDMSEGGRENVLALVRKEEEIPLLLKVLRRGQGRLREKSTAGKATATSVAV